MSERDDQVDVAGAAEELRQANEREAPASTKRSFPRKNPPGRPRKDGRPAGSGPPPAKEAAGEKKQTIRLDVQAVIEKEMLPVIALAPLGIAAMGLSKAFGVAPELIRPTPQTTQEVQRVVAAALPMLGIEVTPGVALAIIYGAALVEMTAAAKFAADAKKAENKQQQAQQPPAQQPPATEPPAPAPPAPDVDTTGPIPESVHGTPPADLQAQA